MIYELKDIENALDKYDGNFSIIFPIVYEKFKKEIINNENNPLHEGEENMFFEFSCFENDYYNIKKDIIINNLLEMPIIDIGCQLGIQSEIFLDMNYLGIDCCEKVFLNSHLPNINYLTAKFPNKDLDIQDKIVISNMSLGFFNNFLDSENENQKNNDTISNIDKMLIENLSKAKVLYCNSRPIFIEELKKHFKYAKKLPNKKEHGVSSGVWKFY